MSIALVAARHFLSCLKCEHARIAPASAPAREEPRRVTRIRATTSATKTLATPGFSTSAPTTAPSPATTVSPAYLSFTDSTGATYARNPTLQLRPQPLPADSHRRKEPTGGVLGNFAIADGAAVFGTSP